MYTVIAQGIIYETNLSYVAAKRCADLLKQEGLKAKVVRVAAEVQS